jgi:Domain of unknown function (DUF4304)
MTAKDKQTDFIKSYLKPTLKQNGYQTSGQTWWKNQDDFFIIVNLQNYSWNDKDNVDFCFNIGIGLTATLKDTEKKKAGYNDLSVHVRESFYLSDDRQEHKYKNNVGYFIKSDTDFEDFKKEMSYDFEKEILPRLDALKSLKDCVDFYGGITFWGDHLKRVISENNIALS